MSEPPDQVLGREDLAKMTIIKKDNRPLTLLEEHKIEDRDFWRVQAFLAREAGYSCRRVAGEFKKSRRTIRRWHRELLDHIGIWRP